MPSILVRDVDKATIRKLKARAAKNGRSLQTEIKDILERSAEEMTNRQLYEAAVEFSKRFETRRLTNSVELIREDRER
jgi:plasmid stability protein